MTGKSLDLKSEKTIAESAAYVKSQIGMNNELTEQEKHNATVVVNVEEWETIPSKRFYSVSVLLLITLCGIGNLYEQQMLNTAF